MRRGLVFLLVMSLVLGCGAPSTPATPVVPPPTVTATPVPPTPTAPPTVTAPPVPPTAEPTTAPEEGEITLGALAVSDEEYVALLNLDAAIVVAQELVSKVAAGELGNDEVYRYLRGLEALWENASDALGSDPRSELVVTAWPAARDALAALEDALTFWAEDEGTSQETLELLQTAQEQMDRALALAAAAMADKYEVSLETMERLRLGARAEIQSAFVELEEPVAERPQGHSRANPIPLGEWVAAPNWDLQVLGVLRGEEAWEALQAASEFNDPPAEGLEYLLVKLYVACTYDDDEQHNLSYSDFGVTGSRLMTVQTEYVLEPEPALDFDLYSGEEAEGWVAFAVGVGETDLILILDELANWDDDRYRFLALEEGASIAVDPALADIAPTSLGATRSEPAPLGETAVTEDWEVAVLEVVRGEAAWEALQEASSWNDPLEEGMEYVLARVRVRHIDTEEDCYPVYGKSFGATGSANVLYPSPWTYEPEPYLNACLFPGGVAEGWVVEQVAVGETNVMLVFEPTYALTLQDTRYLAVDEGASLTVDPALEQIPPSDLGVSPEAPAPLGEMAITQDWQVRVLEVLRGDEAWEALQEASSWNDPPEEGMEYVLVRLWARRIGTQEHSMGIGEGHLRLIGDVGEPYEPPYAIEPAPEFGFELFPGGEGQGWATLQAAEDEPGLILVFDPPYERRAVARYLALE